MEKLISQAWRIYSAFSAEPFVVNPSIPILFFGDFRAYSQSRLKIITVGLNPSCIEFPNDAATGDVFSRFPAARELYPAILDGLHFSDYLKSLGPYFHERPYKRWFSTFEPILNGLDGSFWFGQANTALHTDLCSPLATDPTWSKLTDQARAALEPAGGELWSDLVEELQPDVVVISIARRHLAKIPFKPLDEWQGCYPKLKHIQTRRYRLASGKPARFLFGKAATTPFGTVSNADKLEIGQLMRERVHAE